MYYFQFQIFFIWNEILIFLFGFLYPEHNNLLWIYFLGVHYFQFQIFIFRIKNIFEILKLCWVQVQKCWVQVAIAFLLTGLSPITKETSYSNEEYRSGGS